MLKLNKLEQFISVLSKFCCEWNLFSDFNNKSILCRYISSVVYKCFLDVSSFFSSGTAMFYNYVYGMHLRQQFVYYVCVLCLFVYQHFRQQFVYQCLCLVFICLSTLFIVINQENLFFYHMCFIVYVAMEKSCFSVNCEIIMNSMFTF